MKLELFLKKWGLVFLSMLFLAGGAANNGFMWFFPATPFLLLFVLGLHKLSFQESCLVTLLLSVICIVLGWNHPENKLIYPYLGAEITFTKESHVNVALAKINDNEIDYPLELKLEELPKTMKLVKVVTNRQGFTTELQAILEDENKNRNLMDEDWLLQSLAEGRIVSSNLHEVKNLQSRWSKNLGNLMYWPCIIFIPTMIFK